jgi:transcriptional enhancer factor
MTTLNRGVDFKDVPKDDAGDGKLSTRVHTYSDSIPKALGSAPLEILPNWRDRFPILDQLHSQDDLKCPIIHLEICLELRSGSLPDRSELWAEFELLILGGKHSRQAVWRCTQSMYKPPDLYGSSTSDPRFEDITSTPRIGSYEPGVGTPMRVSFPVSPWAHALQRLSTMEAEFSQAMQSGAPIPTPTTARQYINQITMFQELFCSSAPNQPFIRRAIICWTFKKCRAGEAGRATWSYLDPSPAASRSACFSPRPGPSHVVSAAMNENFNAWADHNMHPSLQLSSNTSAHGANPFDSLSQFDDLPPLTDIGAANGMNFNFANYGYSNGENLSFMSHETHDSDSTLVDAQIGNGDAAAGIHLDSLFGNPSGVGGLGAFDHGQMEHGHGLWEAPPIQSFESDPAFAGVLVGFGSLQSHSGAMGGWDATGAGSGDGKSDWNGNEGSFAAVGVGEVKGEWNGDDGFGGYHLGEDGRGK